MAPPHPNTGVNFVQPSAAQQYQNFEQLNTANPTNPSNNNRRKGWNRNNNNPNQGGNQPPQQQPTGATLTKGTKTLKGAITTNAKGETPLKPYTLVPFVESMVIIPTIVHRSLISRD
jgi:hypothetical protein